MRKHNHLIPPALKHDSRLINAVVRSGKCKRPNAQKHGIYAAAAIIPGEDPREYRELLDELMAEWKPSGPTLREGVVDLADWIWKRRRLRRFIQTQLIGGMFHPSTPAFDEAWGLIAFTHYLCTEPRRESNTKPNLSFNLRRWSKCSARHSADGAVPKIKAAEQPPSLCLPSWPGIQSTMHRSASLAPNWRSRNSSEVQKA